jgi:hypothetical protein
MRTVTSITFVTVALLSGAAAGENGTARPNIIHRELVTGMPRGDRQQVRVISASFEPGDKTVFHTHRFPVTEQRKPENPRLAGCSYERHARDGRRPPRQAGTRRCGRRG